MNKFTFLLSIIFSFLIISCNEKKNKKILDINEINKPVENKQKEEIKTVIIDTMRPIFDL